MGPARRQAPEEEGQHAGKEKPRPSTTGAVKIQTGQPLTTKKDNTKGNPGSKSPFHSKAPPPIKPVGGGALRVSQPEVVRGTLDRFPQYFPAHLEPRTEVIIAKACKEFPEPSQVKERIKKIISELRPSYCTAVHDGQLSARLALPVLNDFLHHLTVANYDSTGSSDSGHFDRFASPFKHDIKVSSEWVNFVEELAELAESRKLHVGQESEPKPKAMVATEAGTHESSSPMPRQDEPGPPQPADSTDGENRAGKAKKSRSRETIPIAQKLADPENYPVLNIEETMQALNNSSRTTLYRWGDEGKLERVSMGKASGKRSKFLVKTESVKKMLEKSSE